MNSVGLDFGLEPKQLNFEAIQFDVQVVKLYVKITTCTPDCLAPKSLKNLRAFSF